MNYDLGKFQMRLRGNYSTSTTYDFLDVVYYDGGSYCSKADGTKGKVPTNTTYWQQIAAAGQSTLTPAQKAEIVAALIEQQGIVIDPNYNQFTTEEKEKLTGLSTPNDTTLTIQVNKRTVGTFSANSKTDKTVNIPVPEDYISTSTVEILTEERNTIERMKQGVVYVVPSASLVAVQAYEDEMANIEDYFTKQNDTPTYFYIFAKEPFTLQLPSQSLMLKGTSLNLDAGNWYRVICRANVWEIQQLATVR